MQLIIQSGDLGPKWFHVTLRALAVMAESDTNIKSNYLSELLGEDATYIRKLMAKLSKAGLVNTHGGRTGGYSLCMEPALISIKMVYHAFEDSPPVPYWSVPSTGTELYISQIIAKAEEQFQSILENYTIADILKYKK